MTQEKFYYHKELRWLSPSDITINEDLRFYAPRERTDLEFSIQESGFLEPVTVFPEGNTFILLKGFERMDVVHEKQLMDIKVPTWVILDPLTDIQKKKLIVDLSKQKQKNYVDYMNEYHLYLSIIPNEQGKNLGGKKRHKLIALMMGLSTSQLSKLLRIDKADPSLLAAVDHEHLTLSQAEQRAKEMERNGRKRDPKNTHPELFNEDKDIEMTPPLTHCPACNRPLANIKWDDIHELFTFKKDDSNSQTTWMEPLKVVQQSEPESIEPLKITSHE